MDNWEKHMILLCKNHYSMKDVDFFTALKRIWAVRCGIPSCGDSVYPTIANTLYSLVNKYDSLESQHLMEVLHSELPRDIYFPDNLTPIQKLIWFYRGRLQNLQVREENETIIDLQVNKFFMKQVIGGYLKPTHKTYNVIKNN